MQAILEEQRYPIGKFQPPVGLTPPDREALIARIEAVPAAMRAAVADLTPEQLDTPYRDGGWTVRQVAHHLPDSHLNGYTRFKLALTEDNPRIKPYDESAWADLPDSSQTPLEVSLSLLEAVHARWVILLRSMTDAQWQRTFEHPDTGQHTLWRALALYAWHGDHHVAHVTRLRDRMSW